MLFELLVWHVFILPFQCDDLVTDIYGIYMVYMIFYTYVTYMIYIYTFTHLHTVLYAVASENYFFLRKKLLCFEKQLEFL